MLVAAKNSWQVGESFRKSIFEKMFEREMFLQPKTADKLVNLSGKAELRKCLKEKCFYSQKQLTSWWIFQESIFEKIFEREMFLQPKTADKLVKLSGKAYLRKCLKEKCFYSQKQLTSWWIFQEKQSWENVWKRNVSTAKNSWQVGESFRKSRVEKMFEREMFLQPKTADKLVNLSGKS